MASIDTKSYVLVLSTRPAMFGGFVENTANEMELEDNVAFVFTPQ